MASEGGMTRAGITVCPRYGIRGWNDSGRWYSVVKYTLPKQALYIITGIEITFLLYEPCSIPPRPDRGGGRSRD